MIETACHHAIVSSNRKLIFYHTSNDWDQLIILVLCEGQVLPVGKEATANHEEKEPEEVLPFIRRSPNPENNLVCFEKFLTQLVFNLVNQRR